MGMSFSFTGAGAASCSGKCVYCSAARQQEYAVRVDTSKVDIDKLKDELVAIDNRTYEQEFKADYEKVEETMTHDPQFIKEMEKPVDQRFGHFDLWFGDPVSSFRVLQDMCEFLHYMADKYEFKISISTSTNGLPLIRDDICQWLVDNNVHIQLSHDGLGNWMRHDEIDMFEWDNSKNLIKKGILNAVNCTLNFWNNDLFKNRDYWLNILRDCFPLVLNPPKGNQPKEIIMEYKRQKSIYDKLYIKLNHIYDGQYDIKALNKHGLYNGKVYESLKGAPIGNLNFRNDVELANKYGIPELAHNLENYIQQYEHIGILLMDPNISKTIEWQPFKNYFDNQLNRYKELKSHDEQTGTCRAFQRWKYQIGDPSSWKETTFVIDTLGNYSECNLIDSEHKTSNPGGVQPETCKGCKYEFQSECNGCGSEKFATECHYCYAWVQMLERMMWMRAMLQSNKNYIKNALSNKIKEL